MIPLCRVRGGAVEAGQRKFGDILPIESGRLPQIR